LFDLIFVTIFLDDAFQQQNGDDVHAKALKLESRVDKMMQEMGSMRKLMLEDDATDNDETDEELFEDPNEDFDTGGHYPMIQKFQQVHL
jgi:hypothetical protein